MVSTFWGIRQAVVRGLLAGGFGAVLSNGLAEGLYLGMCEYPRHPDGREEGHYQRDQRAFDKEAEQ